ncbi:LuxR family transcriptional regulator [Mycobacterium sp. AZCC_0083]|uniref:helix-turn-helix transcriptional regulator n=1 Tax=Mycobacterium sp. AZCC_0083 TaxID=2735882 RepID=UPI00160FCCB4|nr:LuxR family transcriptional regulator [Mycobacterium sp. AZCC_0083]MBB5168165.1 DNA-binding CsgD family transcriptional regulator [Mycobacterium sp. AZCC_0083]
MGELWPLTGRDEECGLITELIEGAEYRGVVLAGGAGVGKSRLAREVAGTVAAEGWSVRHVAATATGRLVPLGAFAQWTDDFEGTPLALARRVIGALTTGSDSSRLLVVVDDAHLLDELSALVLHQLVLQRAAVVVATMRSGQPAPDAVTALWKDGLIRRVEVQPLSHRETGELLRAVFGLPPDRDCEDRMWRLTAGNVLFLQQIVEHEDRAGRLVRERGWCRWQGRPEVSSSLVELVEQQIGAVRESVRDVVDMVAVAEPVDWHCLSTLVDQGALEEAEQRELIRTEEDAVYVGHPLYAEVRLDQCGPLRLRRLRGLVAAAMKNGSEPANVVRRGLLWLESDLPSDPEVLSAAATAASSLLDFDLAARLSRAADESGVGVEARVHLAYNLLMSQQGGDAAMVIDSIATDEVSESAFINDVILRAANLLWTMRSPEESWRVIDEALDDATGPRRGQLLAFRANQLVLAARPADVIGMMDTVDYGHLDGYGESVRLCAELLALAEVGRTTEALAKAQACYAVVESSQQGSFLSGALAEFHSFGLTISGRIREAVEVAQRHRHECVSKPATTQAMGAAIVGMTALSAGDLDGALRHLPTESAAKDADLVLANSFYRFQLLRAQALARLGDVAAAEEAVRIADADRHPTYVLVELNAHLAKAWLAAARHRSSEAREFARRAADFTRAHGQIAREVLCLQTLVQFDDTSVIDRLTELAAVVEGPRAALVVRYAHALQADDADELERVSADFEHIGDALAAADAVAQAATSHRRAGRSGSAMTAASRAGAMALACGGAISPALAAARLLLPLTRRELEIAILVAEGLSNREIADSVCLSVRTVEGHIYRASCKAGVARRSELASVVSTLMAPQ